MFKHRCTADNCNNCGVEANLIFGKQGSSITDVLDVLVVLAGAAVVLVLVVLAVLVVVTSVLAVVEDVVVVAAVTSMLAVALLVDAKHNCHATRTNTITRRILVMAEKI